MASISDVLSTIQNGVVAVNNLTKQINGSFNSIVRSFNGRVGVVTPTQGDYPTSLIPGTTTNDSAIAGNIGQFITATSSAVSMTSTVGINLTSIDLTAGDWDITAGFFGNGSGTPVVSDYWCSINTVTATNVNTQGQAFRVRGFNMTDPVILAGAGPLRASISGNTTYFLNAQVTFAPGTFSTTGIIRARRIR